MNKTFLFFKIALLNFFSLFGFSKILRFLTYKHNKLWTVWTPGRVYVRPDSGEQAIHAVTAIFLPGGDMYFHNYIQHTYKDIWIQELKLSFSIKMALTCPQENQDFWWYHFKGFFMTKSNV